MDYQQEGLKELKLNWEIDESLNYSTLTPAKAYFEIFRGTTHLKKDSNGRFMFIIIKK